MKVSIHEEHQLGQCCILLSLRTAVKVFIAPFIQCRALSGTPSTSLESTMVDVTFKRIAIGSSI